MYIINGIASTNMWHTVLAQVWYDTFCMFIQITKEILNVYYFTEDYHLLWENGTLF